VPTNFNIPHMMKTTCNKLSLACLSGYFAGSVNAENPPDKQAVTIRQAQAPAPNKKTADNPPKYHGTASTGELTLSVENDTGNIATQTTGAIRVQLIQNGFSLLQNIHAPAKNFQAKAGKKIPMGNISPAHMGNIPARTGRVSNKERNFIATVGILFTQARMFSTKVKKIFTRVKIFFAGAGNIPARTRKQGKGFRKTSKTRQMFTKQYKENSHWLLFNYSFSKTTIMADYIPFNDAEFDIWQSNLLAIAGDNLTPWGIPASDLDQVKASQATWTDAWAKANNRQNRTAGDVKAKDEAAANLKKAIRLFVAEWLASNSRVADADRTRMGITVKNTARTAVPVPSTSPVASIDFSVRLQHTIHFADETTPRLKAKPAGVHGCEIYTKVGDAPKDVSELVYAGTDTATPFVQKFDGDKTGKTAYYALRWVNTRGESGPWSAIVSAVVG
jgi:hypothetical protein